MTQEAASGTELPFNMDAMSLVGRAVKNARPRKAGSYVRWSVVADTFGIGSTYATHLCKHFGVNPDDLVKR